MKKLSAAEPQTCFEYISEYLEPESLQEVTLNGLYNLDAK